MKDVMDLIIGLKHHAFIEDKRCRNCISCPYNRYDEECEIQLTKDALMMIKHYRNETHK